MKLWRRVGWALALVAGAGSAAGAAPLNLEQCCFYGGSAFCCRIWSILFWLYGGGPYPY